MHLSLSLVWNKEMSSSATMSCCKLLKILLSFWQQLQVAVFTHNTVAKNYEAAPFFIGCTIGYTAHCKHDFVGFRSISLWENPTLTVDFHNHFVFYFGQTYKTQTNRISTIKALDSFIRSPVELHDDSGSFFSVGIVLFDCEIVISSVVCLIKR